MDYQPGRSPRQSYSIEFAALASMAPGLEPGCRNWSAAYSTDEDGRVKRPFPTPPCTLRRRGRTRTSAADIGKPVELPAPEGDFSDGGSWGARAEGVLRASRRRTASSATACIRRAATSAPDLTNLIHRDYPSVMRDITQPSFAINPDHVAYVVRLKDDRTLTGVIRTIEGKLHIGDKDGKTTVIDKADVAEMRPSPLSIMPDDLLKKLD